MWAAPSSALETTAGGMKVGCFAAGNNKLSQVSEGIQIYRRPARQVFQRAKHGGGAWHIRPSARRRPWTQDVPKTKYKLSMRVIGDTGTKRGAAFSETSMRRCCRIVTPKLPTPKVGDVSRCKVVYQATVMCSLKDSSTVTLETNIAMVKGLIESLIYILSSRPIAARGRGDPQKKSPPGKEGDIGA